MTEKKLLRPVMSILRTALLIAFSMIATFAYTQQKEILLEWFASAKVPFSPDAARIIEELKLYYPINDVALHSSTIYLDSMFNSDSKAVEDKFSINAYPSGMINRRMDSFGLVALREYWQNYIKKELAKDYDLEIEVMNDFDPNTRELKINVQIDYIDSVNSENYLNIYIVENNVTGFGGGYQQRNDYNNISGHPYFGKGDPIRDYEHQNVLRKSVYGIKGEKIGSSFTKGASIKRSATITLPYKYNPEEVKVVAFVSRYSNNSNGNGNYVLNSRSAPAISDCKANFSFKVNNKKVTFYGKSEGYDRLKWSFGDGDTSNLDTVEHLYSKGGKYNVVLEIYSNGKLCDTMHRKVSIPYTCLADFNYSVNQLKVSFNNKSSGDSYSYSWDFGDGNGSSNENPVYTFTSPGTYSVTLNTFDPDKNLCNSKTENIKVKNSQCEAKFSFKVNELDLTFTNESTGDIASRMWDFGDGNQSTNENPDYTYNTKGTYNVCLTNFDSDDDSCGTKYCQEISVDDDVSTLNHANSSFAIYPNPSSGVFYLATKPKEVKKAYLYNSQGKLIEELQFNEPIYRLDLSSYSNGMYMLRIPELKSDLSILFKE